MIGFLYIAITIASTCCFAILFASKNDSRYLIRTVLATWIIAIPLLAYVNMVYPFSGDGDDSDYFEVSTYIIKNFSEVVDFSRFVGVQEQPGYPIVLSALNFFLGEDLLGFKIFNLAAFIVNSLVWYRIGFYLSGNDFGRKLSLIMIFLTPLWLYCFFLRKDMIIVLLQSFIILYLIECWIKLNLFNIVKSLIPIFLLFLFRTPLVIQSVLVLLLTFLLSSSAKNKTNNRSKLYNAIITFSVAIPILLLGGDQEFLSTIGITSGHRTLGSREMIDSISNTAESSSVNLSYFPILYILTETSGLNPNMLKYSDPGPMIRGILAIPWIALASPFFVFGIKRLLTDNNKLLRWSIYNRLAFSSPWFVIFIFQISYIVLSFSVGDTTRWRLPDMPVFATISYVGWRCTNRKFRFLVLITWVFLLVLLFSRNLIFVS